MRKSLHVLHAQSQSNPSSSFFEHRKLKYELIRLVIWNDNSSSFLSLALACHSFVRSSMYVESHRESIYFASLLVVVVLVNKSFFTQFIHRPSKLESYVCLISLIHFYSLFPSCIVESTWLGFSHQSAHGKKNEEKRSHQRKLKSIDQFSFALSELFFRLQSLELSEHSTLIDMFKCVFQVALMMCNSTFSTTTKCAFPIFILNYFALARFHLKVHRNFIVRSQLHMQWKLAENKMPVIAAEEASTKPSIFAICHTQIFCTN